MKKIFIRRLMALTIISSTLLITLPISANAEWKQDSNGWWNTEGKSWSVGWRQIDGKWYYFNNDGYMVHDTTIDGQYKIDNNGVWIQNTTNNVNNSTNTTNNINNGIINNGVININNSSTTENTGKIVGWREIDGEKYFYDANGVKVISTWVNVGGKWYYFDSNGVMLRHTWFNDKKTNKSFYLQDDGSKAVNTIIDGKYKVDENGVWIGNVSESNSTNSNNFSDEKEDIDVKDTSDLKNYLNEEYSKLKTPLGTLKFDFTIRENDSDMFPYDVLIQTDWGDIDNPKYDDMDFFSPYDLEHSVKISESDKEETKELLKDYQEKVAKVSMKYFPDKKIQGGFYSGYYKYKYLRTGYESIKFLSWTNYNSDARNYGDSEISGFEWNSKYDDYDFN